MAAANNDFQLSIPEAAQNADFKLGSDVTVPCYLSPKVSAVNMEIRWFKETDCVCLYKNRKITEAKDYVKKVSLITDELNRGNVSLKLQHFRESDVGDYVCQVTSGDTTQEITIQVKEELKLQRKEEKRREEPQKRSLLTYVAAGAVVGVVCAPVALAVAAAAAGAAAGAGAGAGAVAVAGAAAGAAGAVKVIARVVGAPRAEQQPPQAPEPVYQRIITFSKVNRAWSEQERQKMERSDLLLELQKHSKHIEDAEICLAEKNKKIKDLEMDNTVLLKEKDQLQKTIQWKDKILEEKDILLEKTNEKLLQTTREVEEKHKHIVEQNTQLKNMNKLISEKERELKRTVKEVEDSKLKMATLRTDLQENVRQLEDEVERLMKKPSSYSAVPRRRSSNEGTPPSISGETSNPESTELVSGSELRLVLLGSSGSEKSSAGNIILNREKNQTDGSTESQQSERRQEEVDGKQVTVVETSDWFCSGLSLEEMRQDVRRCISLSAPGPHAFLLVIPAQQSTGGEMLEKMEEILGEKCWRNTIILFTVSDEKQKKNIEEFIQSGNQEMQRLVEKCGNRFHCLNIHQGADASQASELLEKIEKMIEGNTERFYSSEIYLENEKEREEFNKAQEEETRQTLDKEVQKALCKFKDVISRFKERITELEQ